MQENKIKSKDSYDVVLLQLPLWAVGAPPLALGLLKSFLAKNGISCKIIDINSHAYATRGKKYFQYWHIKNGWNYTGERETMFKFYRDYRTLMLYYMDEIKKANPLIVGCSVFDASRIVTEIFLEDLRKIYPGYKHILGGPGVAHFMKNTDELLSHDHIDAICQDEGEVSFVEYVKAVKNNTGLPVAGIVYKSNGKILSGAPSVYTGALDTLPYPDFEGINLNNHPTRTLPTYSSRGCPNKCNYCSAIGFMTNKRYPFRIRSAQRIFDEIVYLKNKYPDLENVRMADNISNGKISNLVEFCDLMISSGMNKKVKWNLENAVIRKEMRKPLYDKLKEAGCTLLGYGMETPVNRLLKEVGKTLAIQKGVDLPAILKEGKESGLFININVMFGLPGETDEDFIYLMEFLRDNVESLSMVNPSLNFTEYYPGSSGHDNPDKIGIDLSKGTMMWSSKDGKNTYITRMKRFEKFCRLARKFKIDNLFQIDEIPNKHKALFEYYYKDNDVKNAKIEYDKIDKKELTEDAKAKYVAITTGDTSFLDKLKTNERHSKMYNDLVKFEDYISYKGNPEDNFISESLSNCIDDHVKIKPYDREYPIATWKHNIRKFTLSASGYNKIEYLIKDILLSMKKIDKILISTLNSKINDNNKLDLIEKAVDELNLFINKTDKAINNFLFKPINQVNKTFYYYNKINRMLNLFVKASKIINDNKSNLLVNNIRDNRIDSIMKELFQLFNTTDENENRVFSKLEIESKIFAFYNRVVGYRNTEKSIIMLHTIMCIIIKKMLKIKNKSSLNISTPAPQAHNLKVVGSNPTPATNHTNAFLI